MENSLVTKHLTRRDFLDGRKWFQWTVGDIQQNSMHYWQEGREERNKKIEAVTPLNTKETRYILTVKQSDKRDL